MIRKFELFIKLSLCVLSVLLAFALLYVDKFSLEEMSMLEFIPSYLVHIAPALGPVFLSLFLVESHKSVRVAY